MSVPTSSRLVDWIVGLCSIAAIWLGGFSVAFVRGYAMSEFARRGLELPDATLFVLKAHGAGLTWILAFLSTLPLLVFLVRRNRRLAVACAIVTGIWMAVVFLAVFFLLGPIYPPGQAL